MNDGADAQMTGHGESKSSAAELAEAYDDLAAAYDWLVVDDLWMRRILRHRFTRLFAAGDRVLDVACGTGLETLFLARCGIRVTGFDISSRAIVRLREKAVAEGLSDFIEVRVHDASQSLPWGPESFDGIVSTFAGLNTVETLRDFSADASRVLKPGGRLMIHMVAPSGIWNRLSLIARLRWREASALRLRRRFGKEISGREIQHHVFPAVTVYHEFFRGHFDLRRAYGLGFLWPQGFGRRLPGSVAYFLGRVEPYLGRLKILLNCGRFFVLEMVKKDLPQMPTR